LVINRRTLWIQRSRMMILWQPVSVKVEEGISSAGKRLEHALWEANVI